jgi:hypothetical protein
MCGDLELSFLLYNKKYIQGVSEIRVLILTSGRTRQFMKLFSITFCKICNSFLPPNFYQTSRFVSFTSLYFSCNHEKFNFHYLIF